MKRTILITPLLIVAGLAMGCTSQDGNGAAPPKAVETSAVQFDKVKTETNEAAQAVKDYAYAERAEFVGKMKKGLVEIQAELDRLSTEVDSSAGAAKAEAETKLDAVREKWARAKKQLDRAESATESSWNDVKDRCNQSYSDLTDSFHTTRQWVSDKIAP